MKSKLILCRALVLKSVRTVSLLILMVMLIGCSPAKPGVTSVKLSPAPIPETAVLIYANSDYGFYSVKRGMEAEVLVARTDKNLMGEQWKRITEVSLANAKLGHSPKTVSIYWDFSKSYRGKSYASLPLRSGSDGLSGFSFLPDKIEFDAHRSVYLIWFNTVGTTDKSVPTRLEIWKKDLDGAFNAR